MGRNVLSLAGVVLMVILCGCATAPESGRSQLILVPQGQEVELGVKEFQEIKQNTPISRDPQMNGMLQRVGRQVIKVTPMGDSNWEFVLFDEPNTANAFALPGGKVGVYTGLFPIIKDESGLATVLSHEIAHAVARHGAERMSHGLVAQMGGMALDQALQSNTEGTRNLMRTAYGAAATVGVILPYSRQQELEADRVGLIYMARAGYDPREAVEFWKRFSEHGSKQGGGKGLELLSTHPVDDKRISNLQQHMAEALAEYRKSKL